MSEAQRSQAAAMKAMLATYDAGDLAGAVKIADEVNAAHTQASAPGGPAPAAPLLIPSHAEPPPLLAPLLPNAVPCGDAKARQIAKSLIEGCDPDPDSAEKALNFTAIAAACGLKYCEKCGRHVSPLEKCATGMYHDPN